MGGGLMQLVAYGAQDIYLTGNPQITFFKVVYRRHTNFAIEAIEQVFTGNVQLGNRAQCTVSRNGDLINMVYLQVRLPGLDISNVTNPNPPGGAPGATLGGTIPTAATTPGPVPYAPGTGTGNALDPFQGGNGAGGVPAAFPIEAAYVNSIGHAIIDVVSVEIGGQIIDTQYGLWLEIWDELTQTAEKWAGYNEMVGKYPNPGGILGNASFNRVYYVPLMFWFCRNPGLSLPLIALQYHEVKINIQFRDRSQVFTLVSPHNGSRPFLTDPDAQYGPPTQGPPAIQASLFIDYVYLDTEERRRFAQMSHEYLIDQLQTLAPQGITLQSLSSGQFRENLNFNHPVKEIVWVFSRSDNAPYNTSTPNVLFNDWFNFSTAPPGSVYPQQYLDVMSNNENSGALLKLNGHNRFQPRPASYFRLVQPYQHHTRIPSKHIYVYAFGLRPEEHQPSGTLNFSRIDNAELSFFLSGDAAAVNATIEPDPYNGTGSAQGGNPMWPDLYPTWPKWLQPFNTVPSGGGPPVKQDVKYTYLDAYAPQGISYAVTIFAVNYNVLRIMSGMGGLAYSN